jgi:hypothetical protein
MKKVSRLSLPFLMIFLALLAQTACAKPVNCSGNACSVIDIKNIKYHPGGTAIREVTIVNNGGTKVTFSIHWQSVFGQCGVSNDGVLSAGESRVITNTAAVYPGWCEVYASKS